METIELSRAVGIAALSADISEMDRLNGIGRGLESAIKGINQSISLLQTKRASIEEKIRENEAVILATASRIDGTLKALYGAATPAPAEEPKKRGRKPKEVQQVQEQERPADAQEEQQPDSPAVCINKECLEHKPDLPNGCKACGDISECGEAVIKEVADTSASTEVETQGAEAAAPGDEAPAEEVQAIEEVTAQELAELQATEGLPGDGAEPPSSPTPIFTPLDEPLGNCELCMGYGVVEGELYGEPTLVPCNCAAGQKVNSIATGNGTCNDCNIADPNCADCNLPDMDAASPVELSIEEQKRRNQYCALWRDQCDPKLADKCFSGLGCALLCKRDKGVIPPKVQEQPHPAVEPTTQQPVQDTAKAKVKDCPHPKALRRKAPEGEFCKVCGQPVSGEQQSSMFGDAA